MNRYSIQSRRMPCAPAGGFTLVEALVALVVLSIGLLGVAGMQLTGLTVNYSAAARTQASYLAYDILDRMRANRNDAVAGANLYHTDIGAAPTGTGLAVQDLVAWKAALASTLPSGDGSVDVAAGIATVTVQWTDDHTAAFTFVTVTQL